MRILFPIILLFTACMVRAQGMGPRLTFDQLMIDKGMVVQGEYDYAFPFTNTGDSTLVIHSVKSSCGCVNPVFDYRPVPAGAKGIVGARFSTKFKTGWQEKTLTVISNDPQNPVNVLRLKAKVLEFQGHLRFTDHTTGEVLPDDGFNRPSIPNQPSGIVVIEVKNLDGYPATLDLRSYNDPSSSSFSAFFANHIPVSPTAEDIHGLWGKGFQDQLTIDAGGKAYMVINYDAPNFRSVFPERMNPIGGTILLPIGFQNTVLGR